MKGDDAIYDVIIIAPAWADLQQAHPAKDGLKTLVIEKHSIPGGYANIPSKEKASGLILSLMQ